MYSKLANLVAVSAMVAGVFVGANDAFAQAGNAGCAPPTGEWMNTELDVAGTRGHNDFTVEADKVSVKESIGDFWVVYSFNAHDVKSIDRGPNEDGVVRLTIAVQPAQKTTSTGEKSAAPDVAIDMPSEHADAAVTAIQDLSKRTGCAK
jgi:hypothetical protein